MLHDLHQVDSLSRLDEIAHLPVSKRKSRLIECRFQLPFEKHSRQTTAPRARIVGVFLHQLFKTLSAFSLFEYIGSLLLLGSPFPFIELFAAQGIAPGEENKTAHEHLFRIKKLLIRVVKLLNLLRLHFHLDMPLHVNRADADILYVLEVIFIRGPSLQEHLPPKPALVTGPLQKSLLLLFGLLFAQLKILGIGLQKKHLPQNELLEHLFLHLLDFTGGNAPTRCRQPHAVADVNLIKLLLRHLETLAFDRKRFGLLRRRPGQRGALSPHL